ncbi:MAG: hypothetical protein ACE366_16355 [Bradymonadia bacterium]
MIDALPHPAPALVRTVRTDLQDAHLMNALIEALYDLEEGVSQSQVLRQINRAFLQLGVVDYQFGSERWRVFQRQNGKTVQIIEGGGEP